MIDMPERGGKPRTSQDIEAREDRLYREIGELQVGGQVVTEIVHSANLDVNAKRSIVKPGTGSPSPRLLRQCALTGPDHSGWHLPRPASGQLS